MGMLSTVICKTVGIAGMSAAIYDAYSVGKKNSQRAVAQTNADYYEHIISSKRTLSSENPVNSALQNKISQLRMNNPLVPMYGKTKGFVSGMFNSLGDNLIPVACASLALLTKGTMSKIGAAGVAISTAITVLKESYGVGKSSPMD